MSRVSDCRDLAALRRRYLFSLAHVCNVPPEAADRLSLGDFAVLLRDIDAYLKDSPAG